MTDDAAARPAERGAGPSRGSNRTPPDIDFPTWVEHQIRSAQAQGAFDNLPGAGKPIPGLGTPQHELAWVANYLRRENVEVAGLLPPQLAIAKEVEDLPTRLLTERTEASAREVVDKLNARISAAHAAPQVGPPFRVKVVDVEAAIEQWRVARAEYLRLLAERRAPATQAREPAPATGRFGRFRRLRGRSDLT